MKYKRKKTGELELFQNMWNNNPHICQVSGDYLPEFSVGFFAHLNGKGAEPGMRLMEENIVIMRYDLHHLFDHNTHKAKEDPRFDWVFELKDKLKAEYNNKKGYNIFR